MVLRILVNHTIELSLVWKLPREKKTGELLQLRRNHLHTEAGFLMEHCTLKNHLHKIGISFQLLTTLQTRTPAAFMILSVLTSQLVDILILLTSPNLSRLFFCLLQQVSSEYSCIDLLIFDDRFFGNESTIFFWFECYYMLFDSIKRNLGITTFQIKHFHYDFKQCGMYIGRLKIQP